MLTSPKNPTIQHIHKLQSQPRYRKETGLFVVEGARLAGECLAAGVKPEVLLHTGLTDLPLLESFRELGVQPLLVNEAVMQPPTTRSRRRVSARRRSLARTPACSFIVVLDGARSRQPETVLHGLGGGGRCRPADPRQRRSVQPKVVRAMGAPAAGASGGWEIEGSARQGGVSCGSRQGRDYTDADFSGLSRWDRR
jgi:hypothetical protein